MAKGTRKSWWGSSNKKNKDRDRLLNELATYPLLLSEYHRQKFNPLTFRLRFSIIRRFNIQLQIVVQMIDLMDTAASWSLGTLSWWKMVG